MADKIRKRGKIGKDVQAKAFVPFKVSDEKPFNLAQLKEVSVRIIDKKNKKKEVIGQQPVLDFTFADKEDQRSHRHTEYTPEAFTSKGGNKFSLEDVEMWQDTKIAHIYNTFMGDEAHGDANLGEFEENEFEVSDKLDAQANYQYHWYSKVAKQFNEDKKGKPVYKDEKDNPTPVWLKLVYNNNDKLEIPMFDNFLDLAIQGRETLLGKGRKERFSPKPKVQAFMNPAAGAAADLPAGTAADAPFEF